MQNNWYLALFLALFHTIPPFLARDLKIDFFAPFLTKWGGFTVWYKSIVTLQKWDLVPIECDIRVQDSNNPVDKVPAKILSWDLSAKMWQVPVFSPLWTWANMVILPPNKSGSSPINWQHGSFHLFKKYSCLPDGWVGSSSPRTVNRVNSVISQTISEYIWKCRNLSVNQSDCQTLKGNSEHHVESERSWNNESQECWRTDSSSRERAAKVQWRLKVKCASIIA